MESRKVAEKIAKNPKNLLRKFLDILSLNVIKLKALISVLHNRAIYKRKNKTRLKLDHLYEHVLSWLVFMWMNWTYFSSASL